MVAPALTADTSGNPFVEVFIGTSGLASGTVKLRLYRFSENRTWLVRGGVDIAPGVAALDFEAPFGVTSTYRAEMLSASDASLGFTDTASITLDVDNVWVHNPLVPAGGVALGPIALLGGTADSIIRPTVGEVIYTEGSTEGTWVGARRRAIQGLNVGLAVEALADADALQAMLGGYNTQQVAVLCIRTSPGVRIPRTFFAAVTEPDEQSMNIPWGGTRSNFVFSATEVRPPFPGLVTPLLTYDDLDAFGTYTEQDANWATYTLRDRAYELAGTAA